MADTLKHRKLENPGDLWNAHSPQDREESAKEVDRICRNSGERGMESYTDPVPTGHRYSSGRKVKLGF